MSMLIFNNKMPALLLVVLLLAACSSTPTPDLSPKPQPASEATEPADAPVAEPEPVDFNQQFYEEAVASLKSGKTELALELLVQVSNNAPEKPWVFTNLGLAYFKLEQDDLAEQAFKQAIARNDDDAVAHNHLGILKRQQGDFADALKRYQRAIKINSSYASAHLNLGILFDIYLQDLEKALQQYQKYQALISAENTQVAGWIVDIERRLKKATSKSQG